MGWSGIKDHGFGSKNRTPEQDDEYRSRIGGVKRKRYWTKERCLGELEDILTAFKKVLRDEEKLNKDNPRKLKQETVKDLVTMMNRILDFMKYLYPPVQQNLNVNVDTTIDKVIDRLKNYKEQEQIVVIGDGTINEIEEDE